MPNAHPCVQGVFKPRDRVITVVDLPKYLNLDTSQSIEKDHFLISHFNKSIVAFRVNSVVGIRRLSWEEMEKIDSNVYDEDKGTVIGIVKAADRLISVIDFEKILMDISPKTGIQISDIKSMGMRQKNDSPILIAEDSPMLSNMIHQCLTEAGYTNLTIVSDGKEAWDILERAKEYRNQRMISCVITDIEMPQMDGHHLTKLIKEDSVLSTIPVILFSSLINDAMEAKGKKLGADAQISKPEIRRLVELLDKFVEK
jgi:two-component system chemotaxis response regulator CheV